jgi:type II secretory pathway pseudopilin PulG
MEPERKIEKLLRAYARKRRADSGDALKLHPATRNLLHGEVARRTPKPPAEDSSLTIWELFRQQWALLLGFVLVIFFGATLFLPSLSSAKHKAQNFSAVSNLKQIGLAAQLAAEENNGKLPASLDALTNGFLTGKVLTDPASSKPFVYVAGGQIVDNLPSNAVLAYSPGNENDRPVLFADGRVEYVNRKRFSELTNRGQSQIALADDAEARQLQEKSEVSGTSAESPTRAPQDADQLKLSSGELYNQTQTKAAQSLQFGSSQFVRKDFAGLQNLFRNTSASAKTASVLASFQLQQNGNAIRVVDQDGSVYEGSLQPPNATLQNTSAPESENIATAERTLDKSANVNGNVQQAAQNYFFRVTGTNLTLKQNVVFNGSLLVISNSAQIPPQTVAGTFGGGNVNNRVQQNLAGQQQQQLPWSNSRIAGTAIIDDTNKIEINAAPLTP